MFESLYSVHLYWSVCLSVQLIKCQGHVREPEIKPQECNHANRVYFLRTIESHAISSHSSTCSDFPTHTLPEGQVLSLLFVPLPYSLLQSDHWLHGNQSDY